ncbi:MAG TPA: amino acid adenylation domain-containing protein, partial [Longimicrobiaceae bacterium]
EWNDTGRDYPRGALVHDLFRAQAERTPDAAAVVFRGRALAYGELERRANRLAHALRRRGVGPESRVGVCLGRTPATLVALLGVLKAGGAYVPLDPAYPAERLEYMLRDSGARVLVTEEGLAGRLPELGGEVVWLENGSTEYEVRSTLQTVGQPDGGSSSEDGVSLRTSYSVLRTSFPESLAYVIYTSGSTGRPKGVAVTHGGLSNYLQWAAEAYGLDGGEGAPVHSSLGFDLTVTSLLLPLVAGRRVVMVPDSLGVEALAEAVRAERDLTLVKLTPRHLALLGEQLAPDEAAGRTRTFVVGGEALAPEDMAFWRRYAPATEIVNEYGPTETVVGCCVRRIPAGEPLSGAVPIGRPIANTRLYVLDRGLEPLPTGVAGELCVGGAGVSRGYLGRPGLTADRFVPDPFGGEPGARMYRTGDRARWLAAGELEFLGRADFQLKVRGFRIEPGEIEAALLEQDGIREAVVTARGEGAGRRLVAHVAGEGAADAARLREALRARLPEYMVPAAFVALDTLPLTPNGKVDRAAFPDPERAGPAAGYEPPRDETEAALCRLWGEVLGVKRVGVRDNFFELGGDSIVSIRVLARARVLGLECTLPDLFRHQTVEALAAHLRGGTSCGERRPEVPPFGLVAAGDRARLPAGTVDAFPATALQLGMIFHGGQDPASALYHDLTRLRVRGPFDAEALRRAVAAAMRRHAVLRSGFELSRFGEPLQLVHGELPAPVAVHDLGALAPEEREAAVDAVWEAEKGSRFDPALAPLFRVDAYRLGPDEFQLLLVHHHAILDGWSV